MSDSLPLRRDAQRSILVEACVSSVAEAIAAPTQPYKVSVPLPAVKPSAVKTAAIGAPRKVTSQAEADQLIAKARKSSGLGVQLGAFSSDAAAAKAWTNLSKRFAYLADLNKSVSPAKVGDGTVYRLRVAAGTAANATNLCGKLRVAGENCVVVR